MAFARSAARTIALAAVLIGTAGALVLAQPERQGDRQPTRDGNPRAEQGAANMIERGDANGDGKLSKDEVDDRFAEAGLFEIADTDKDGFLVKDEIVAFFMQRGGGRFPGGGPPPRGEPGQPLGFHDQMENAGRALRSLRRSDFDAASRAADLNAIGSLQQALVGAKGEIDTIEMAPQAAAKYGQDEAAYHKDFRMSMVNAIAATLELERAVLEGDSDQAKESLEALNEVRSRSHDAFQEEEDH